MSYISRYSWIQFTVFVFHFLVQINKSHCLATCISFLAWTGARAWTTKIFYGQPNQVLWLPQGQLDIKVNFEPWFHDNTSPYFPMKWHLRNERRNTQIWVVLLIGWSKFPMHHNQSEALPRSGKQHVISMEFLHVVASQNIGCFQWQISVIFRPNWGLKGRNIFLF